MFNSSTTVSPELALVLKHLNEKPTSLEASLPPLYRDTKLLNEIKGLRGSEKSLALKIYARQVLPKGQKNRNLLAVITDYALALGIGAEAFSQLHGSHSSIFKIAIAIPPTLFAADLFSGFVHKYLDSWSSESGPLGEAARAFRLHHENPDGMSENTYLENTGDTAKILAPLFGVVAAAPLLGVHVDPVAGTSSMIFLTTLINAQIFHAEAHAKTPSKFFKFLQDSRLALSKEQHLQHHRPPFADDFSSVNGWSNPVTRKLWPYLDLVLWRAMNCFFWSETNSKNLVRR
jgi:hypothetical protein